MAILTMVTDYGTSPVADCFVTRVVLLSGTGKRTRSYIGLKNTKDELAG